MNDLLDSWKARWGINRMNWLVPPGLYAIGAPHTDSPVLVTANYKLSYDIVRSNLCGRSAWLLVLETYGINVWCAAGKGTFGTDEIVRRVHSSALDLVVRHRALHLPILGAPGVAAHEVLRRCGFRVNYAAIRASDLPEYLDNGMVTTTAMRKLTFTLLERAVLIPVEMVTSFKPNGIIAALLFLLFALFDSMGAGINLIVAYTGAVLAGTVAAPLLLPLIPGRSFAVKGALAGLLWVAIYGYLLPGHSWNTVTSAAAFLALPAVSSFHALNFTGCTPYTSRSGVKKEMRLALPVMGCAIIAGLILLISGTFA